jgi:hypothetical protein
MSEKIQGAWPDDYRQYGPGFGMQQYLRDGEIDAGRAFVEAADALAGMLVALRHRGEFHQPSDAAIDAAIEIYEAARREFRP